MILIGSRALTICVPHLLNRKSKDFDFIGNKEEILHFIKSNDLTIIQEDQNKIICHSQYNPPCEFEIIQPNTSNQLFESLVKNNSETISTDFGLIPNINLLFTLKASHRFLKNSPHFWKTVKDYHLMKSVGASILPEYRDFFKLREKETYNYKHPKLNVNKANFFNHDQITYLYDHDSIHQAVKILDKPAYQYYQKDGEEVKSDKKKFFVTTDEVRFSGVLEECATLALERSLIPYPNKLTPKQAFNLALFKVCSSITSGWFREFAYENIFTILQLSQQYQFFDKFQNNLNIGLIKKYATA